MGTLGVEVWNLLLTTELILGFINDTGLLTSPEVLLWLGDKGLLKVLSEL